MSEQDANNSEVSEEDTPTSISDLASGPYLFNVFDGKDEDNKRKYLELELDEWTLDAEKWAKSHYKSMQNLFNKLMHIECDNDETVDAAIAVCAYKLTDDSRRMIEERRGDNTTEEYLRKNLNYKMLIEVSKAEYEMIKGSIPIDALKKSHEAMIALQKRANVTMPIPTLPK